MDQKKIYRIPRKVNEPIRILGLTGKDMLIMLPFVVMAFIIFYLTAWPVGAKIVISSAIIFGLYALLTMEMANGLRGLEYLKLLIRFYIFDQNDYHLTSGNVSEDEAKATRRMIRYHKPPKVVRTPLISEYPDFDAAAYWSRHANRIEKEPVE